MKKIAFFDLDGTLVSHKINQVPESTRRTLSKMQKKGILIVLATGRHEKELLGLPARDIPFDGFLTLNGQMCREKEGKVFYESPLGMEDVVSLHQLFLEKKIPIIFKEKERIYINFINEKVEQAQKEINSPLPPIGDYRGEEIYQVVVFVDEENEDQIQKILKDSTIARWNPRAIDIVPKTGGKGRGILEYLKGVGMNVEDAMAFGDGPNDLEMLKTVSLGICMGNGDPDVKKNSDYVTDSVDEDGIEKAMLKLGYI